MSGHELLRPQPPHTSVPLSGHNPLKTQATSQSQSSCGHSVTNHSQLGDFRGLTCPEAGSCYLPDRIPQCLWHWRLHTKRVIRKCFCFPVLHVHPRCENSLAAWATPLTSGEMTGHVVLEPLSLQSHLQDVLVRSVANTPNPYCTYLKESTRTGLLMPCGHSSDPVAI